MSVMAQRKPKRSGQSVNVYLPDDLKEAVDAFVNSTRPKTSMKAVIVTALEDFLTANNLWPPKKKKE